MKKLFSSVFAYFYFWNFKSSPYSKKRKKAIKGEKYITRKKKSPPVKAKQSSIKSISVETLINEAETELKKINAAIATDSSNADYKKLGSLYEEKSRLEERIESLYSEWVKENECPRKLDAENG